MAILSEDILLLFIVLFPAPVHTKEKVELRLVNGHSTNQGCIQIRRDSQEYWRPVCDDDGFKENAANVVCRQLGYRYSKVERAIYKPKIPNFVLGGVKCNGDETNILECAHGVWDQPHCFVDYCAGVCCSNSSTFGEQFGDYFESHCSAKWKEAQEQCDTIGSTIASLENYKHIANDVVQQPPHTESSLWTGSFFTPWIWSNGCYNASAAFNTTNDANVSNNSPQLCLQLCGADPDTTFALSGRICRCLQPTHHWSPVLYDVNTSECTRRCAGDSNQYCGGRNGIYWSLYSIASEDAFTLVVSPTHGIRRQCAILAPAKKLNSESCDSPHGYICSDLQDGGSLRHIAVNTNVNMITARQLCRNHSNNWRLSGRDILQREDEYSTASNPWIDIERMVISVYGYNDYEVTKTLEPLYCQSINSNGSQISAFTIGCAERLSYFCTRKKYPRTFIHAEEDYNTDSSASTTQTDEKRTTADTQESTNTTDEQGDAVSYIIVYVTVSIVSAVVFILVLVLICCCWCRRSKEKHSASGRHRGDSRTTDTDLSNGHVNVTQVYSTLSNQCRNNDEESQYEEIKEKENLYNEIQEPTNINSENKANINAEANENDNVNAKDPLMVKISYTNPVDKVQKREHLTITKSNSYMDPYDSLKGANSNTGDLRSQT